MEVLYNSTRSKGNPVKASEAILKGLSDDGGLFVPNHIPALDKSLKELAGMTYQQVAYEVMKLFLTDFFSPYRKMKEKKPSKQPSTQELFFSFFAPTKTGLTPAFYSKMKM